MVAASAPVSDTVSRHASGSRSSYSTSSRRESRRTITPIRSPAAVVNSYRTPTPGSGVSNSSTGGRVVAVRSRAS